LKVLDIQSNKMNSTCKIALGTKTLRPHHPKMMASLRGHAQAERDWRFRRLGFNKNRQTAAWWSDWAC
jgi:hypothetical protein